MEDKTITYSILGIVGILAVVGLVMALTNATGFVVPPGAKLYGGELRQAQGDPMRPLGEEALRATPTSYPPYQQYGHRKAWDRGLDERNICPYSEFPVMQSPTRAPASLGCIPSHINPAFMCCKFTGQHGQLVDETGLYE